MRMLQSNDTPATLRCEKITTCALELGNSYTCRDGKAPRPNTTCTLPDACTETLCCAVIPREQLCSAFDCVAVGLAANLSAARDSCSPDIAGGCASKCCEVKPRPSTCGAFDCRAVGLRLSPRYAFYFFLKKVGAVLALRWSLAHSHPFAFAFCVGFWHKDINMYQRQFATILSELRFASSYIVLNARPIPCQQCSGQYSLQCHPRGRLPQQMLRDHWLGSDMRVI
jgi:hypothetical protein